MYHINPLSSPDREFSGFPSCSLIQSYQRCANLQILLIERNIIIRLPVPIAARIDITMNSSRNKMKHDWDIRLRNICANDDQFWDMMNRASEHAYHIEHQAMLLYTKLRFLTPAKPKPLAQFSVDGTTDDSSRCSCADF